MSHKMLRPFIVNMSVLGYFPYHIVYVNFNYIDIYIYIYILLFFFFIWWSPFIPSRNLDEVFTYNHIWL